jgi:hypothetical protein
VAMADASQICAFLVSKGAMTEADASSFHRAPAWLATADVDALTEFVKVGNSLWIATLGPGDLVYLPAGFITTHKVNQGSNLIGLRIGVVAKSDGTVMEALKVSHGQAGKTCSIVDQVLGFIGEFWPKNTGAIEPLIVGDPAVQSAIEDE